MQQKEDGNKPITTAENYARQMDAEHKIIFDHCRRLGLPLMSPPRAPEAIDALASEVERLRDLYERADRAATILRAEVERLATMNAEDRAACKTVVERLQAELGNK